MLKASTPSVVLTRRFKGEDSVIASVPLDTKRLYLKVEAKGQSYSFSYSVANEEWRVLQENVDGRTLSRTNAGGFVGTMIGPYASSNGTRSGRYAEFDWFEYKGEAE
jgi:alpha-N-arabinofuranosidase